MKLELMKSIPRTRGGFERNFHVLEERMREGKIHFASHLEGTVNGLLKVRKLPNGRINFLTVNEIARLTANTVAEMGEMNLPASQMQQTPIQGAEDTEVPRQSVKDIEDTDGSDNEGDLGESDRS